MEEWRLCGGGGSGGHSAAADRACLQLVQDTHAIVQHASEEMQRLGAGNCSPLGQREVAEDQLQRAIRQHIDADLCVCFRHGLGCTALAGPTTPALLAAAGELRRAQVG